MTGESPTVRLPGVALDLLASWLDKAKPGLRQGTLTGEVLTGGKSNLTYRITDGTSIWALRRPPLAHVLPTAHDMTREWRVINALQSTAIPVAEAVVLCEDATVLGAPFYLTGFVDGLVLDRPEVLEGVTPEVATRVGKQLMDTLVDLHEVDPGSVGLAEFGRAEGFLARQVQRWAKQWKASETRPRAVLGRVVELLTRTVPEQSPPAIVHGDYRLTNVMFDPLIERIAAVVDWEMATLGDPLTDLGLTVVYHALSTKDDSVMPLMRPADGYLSPEDLVARYAARSPRDLSQLDWYTAFAFFKLAVIAEGIHSRYLAGKTVGAGFDHVGDSVPVMLDEALALLSRR